MRVAGWGDFARVAAEKLPKFWKQPAARSCAAKLALWYLLLVVLRQFFCGAFLFFIFGVHPACLNFFFRPVVIALLGTIPGLNLSLYFTLFWRVWQTGYYGDFYNKKGLGVMETS